MFLAIGAADRSPPACTVDDAMKIAVIGAGGVGGYYGVAARRRRP